MPYKILEPQYVWYTLNSLGNTRGQFQKHVLLCTKFILCSTPNFWEAFWGVKVWRWRQNGLLPTLNAFEINPWSDSIKWKFKTFKRLIELRLNKNKIYFLRRGGSDGNAEDSGLKSSRFNTPSRQENVKKVFILFSIGCFEPMISTSKNKLLCLHIQVPINNHGYIVLIWIQCSPWCCKMMLKKYMIWIVEADPTPFTKKSKMEDAVERDHFYKVFEML